MRFDVAGKFTRSEIGFTQGFEVRDGMLYESTGRIGGTTKLNTISFTGKVTTLADLGISVFGEGLTILNDEIFQLTWQDHKVYVYDLADIWSSSTEAEAQSIAQAIRDRTQAQLAIVSWPSEDFDVSTDTAEVDAHTIINTWGVGRAGLDRARDSAGQPVGDLHI
jgi:hypothetical protein